MIKAITFDLDGVYFIKGKFNFLNAIVNLGVDRKDAEKVFFGDKMNKQYKLGKMTDNQFWGWAINQWELDITVKELIDLMIKGYEVNREVEKLVKKVRNNGYKALICSNNFPARIKGLDERFNFLKDFDVAVYSYEVGIAKPDKKIFQELVKLSGVSPKEIVFADDDIEKISGAKEVGIQAFLYEDFDKFVDKLKALGVVLS
jgi:putative hydrolase of the HAD superfamily